MRFQVIFQIFLFLLAFSVSAYGDCFDFKTKILKPLRAAPALKSSSDVKESGKRLEDEATWAGVRGVVAKPIETVLKLLEDHDNTRSTRAKDFDVSVASDPNYLSRHRVKFKIHPFPFITIEWDEEWRYALAAGTVEKPEEIVISYQKVEGTSHIQHLCGSMVLRKLSATSTDVYVYEEAKATQRSVGDTLNGQEGTMKMLRK